MWIKDIIAKKLVELGETTFLERYKAKQRWLSSLDDAPLCFAERVLADCPDEQEQMVPNAKHWEGRELCFLLPVYKTTHPFSEFCFKAIWDRSRMRVDMRNGDAKIERSRNILATRFVNSGCTWSLWVDDDIVFPIGNAEWFKHRAMCQGMNDRFAGINAVDQLMSRQKTIVSGVYFGRHPGGRSMYAPAIYSDQLTAKDKEGPENKLIEADWAATGFLLVHRNVYLDIQKTFPELAPKTKDEPWNFFSPTTDERTGGLNAGEDTAFGLRARIAGHKTYVDKAVYLGHIGQCVYNYINTRE